MNRVLSAIILNGALKVNLMELFLCVVIEMELIHVLSIYLFSVFGELLSKKVLFSYVPL